VCRKGCTLELDVEFNGNGTRDQGFGGGGTYRFLRKTNLVAGIQEGQLMIDGTVEVAGTFSGDYVNCSPNHDVTGYLKFVDGAAGTVNKAIVTDGHQFLSPDPYTQEGGTLTASYLQVATTRSGDGITRSTYNLNGGSLTLANALLVGARLPAGWFHSAANGDNSDAKLCAAGRFNMNGGTLRTPEIRSLFNSNYCQLLGGDVYLGAAGFTKTTDAYLDGAKANTTAPIVLGAATLHATDASWAVTNELSTAKVPAVELRGGTVFDVAADKEIALNGAVAGAGGFTKTGAGALLVNGAYTATGDIAVNGGTLTFAASALTTLSINVLTLCGDDALTLAAGQVINVKSLVVDGVAKIGSVGFGEGQVVVVGNAWSGAAGDGKWSSAGNWADGVPGLDDDVYIGKAATIEIDDAASAKSLIVAGGAVTFTGTGALTFGEVGEVKVAEGATATFGSSVKVSRALAKTGTGTVRFEGLLRCTADVAALAWPNFLGTNEFKVVQGEAVMAGEVEGLRVYPCSPVAADMPLLTIADGAVMTNRCFVHAAWAGYNGTGYGDLTMTGGLVDNDSGAVVFRSWGNSELIPGNTKKYGFCFFKAGKSNIALNGGTFRCPNAPGHCMNIRNTNVGGGTVTLTVGGGHLWISDVLYLSTQNNEVDTFVLNDGLAEISLIAAGSGSGKKIVKLNGGEFRAHKRYDGTKSDSSEGMTAIGINRWYYPTREKSAFEPVEIGGPVRFTQDEADVAFTICAPVKVTYADAVLSNETGTLGLGYAGCGWVPEGDFAVQLADGGKMNLGFADTKDVKSVTIGGKLRVAGDYGVGHHAQQTFPGGGIFHALEGSAPQGLLLMVR